MLGNLIGGFIVIVVGVSLMPSVADEVSRATYSVYTNATIHTTPNVTGAAATVTNLITLFYAIGVMSAGVAITVGGLKSAGIM